MLSQIVPSDGGGGHREPALQALPAPPAVGPLLRGWRRSRGLSQLGLALDAGVSARHLSFVETGRATPSARLIIRLAGVLDVPALDRNVLLIAAGHAPRYAET